METAKGLQDEVLLTRIQGHGESCIHNIAKGLQDEVRLTKIQGHGDSCIHMGLRGFKMRNF